MAARPRASGVDSDIFSEDEDPDVASEMNSFSEQPNRGRLLTANLTNMDSKPQL